MEITQAKDTDINEIIGVLKISLGEALMPKSEAYFIWKHFKNPFGKSIIYLAKENNKIVGIRAFMHWNWTDKDNLITSVRAVDTATHPDFQGKGIFSKLTLEAVKKSIDEKIGFVFNTPNPISMIGYLKLGWYSIGRMPVYFMPNFSIPHFYISDKVNEVYNSYSAKNAIDQLPLNWQLKSSKDIMDTPLTKDYLYWRYVDCPVAQYGAIVIPNQYGFIFRIKKVNRFMELRLCELWIENSDAQKEFNKALNLLKKQIKPLFLSCAASPLLKSKSQIPPGFYGPIKKGPVVTLKHLALNNLNIFEDFSKWNPSLGTMELF
jgi:hypothetical protein